MKRFFKSLALGILLALPWIGAQAQQANVYCVQNPAAPPYRWAPCNWSISVDGNLSVATQPYPEFFDAFSSTLDTTTNWTANNSTGTAATSGGALVVSSSTTNAAWGGVGSKQSWAPSGISPQLFGVSVAFTNSTIANTARVFGIYTVPGTPTTAIPATDGYLWRLDGSGNLFAEIWSAGAAISSTNVTTACKPADGTANLYGINFRTSLAIFTCGSTTAATAQGLNPSVQTLPVSVFSIAGTSPGSSATMTLHGLALTTYTPAGVKEAAQAATINDPSMVVQVSPNQVAIPVSGTVTASSPVGITPTDRTITSATGSSQIMMAANASRHSMTIENTGNANCGVNPTGGTAAIGGAGTITLSALGAYTPRIPTLSAVTVICTAGQPIYGDEN